MSATSIHLTRVAWCDPRAMALRAAMDAEMTERYAGSHDDDAAFDAKAARAFGVDPADVVATILLESAGAAAVAHLAVRRLGGRLEVKKVYVAPSVRGRGLSRVLMSAAEEVAREVDATSLVLQTGDRQPDAVRLYESLGYRRIPVYEPYREIHNSICFEKALGTEGTGPRGISGGPCGSRRRGGSSPR